MDYCFCEDTDAPISRGAHASNSKMGTQRFLFETESDAPYSSGTWSASVAGAAPRASAINGMTSTVMIVMS